MLLFLFSAIMTPISLFPEIIHKSAPQAQLKINNNEHEWHFPDKTTLINFPFGDSWKRGFFGRGVYLIGNFYVGTSENIKNRIKEHLAMYRRQEHSDIFLASMDAYLGRKLPIFYLSDDITQEYNYALFLKGYGLPIINDLTKCKGYGAVVLEKRIDAAIEMLTMHGYEVSKPIKI
jgi:hypothetical protein